MAHASETEADIWTDEELKRAEEEDLALERLLDDGSDRPRRPMSTPESIAAGAAAMAEGRQRAAEALARRLANVELLSAEELRSALGETQQSIDDAVASNRLFAFQGPGGERYYPAFYAVAEMDRASLELVTQELLDLLAPSNTTSS